MSNVILIIIALLYSVLGIVFAIELGELFLLVNPRSGIDKKPLASTSHAWKMVYSVLLILSISVFALLFHTKLPINRSLNWLLLITIILLFEKAIFRRIFRGNLKYKNGNYKLLISSYLILLSYSAIGIYFITGKQFWDTFVGWVLIVTVFLGISIISLSYINRKPTLIDRPSRKQFLLILFSLWCIFLGYLFPIAFAHYNINLIGTSLTVLEAVIVVSFVSYLVVNFMQKKPHELYQYVFLMAFLTPIALAWNNHPYLVSLRIKLRLISLSHSYQGGYIFLVWLIFVLMVILLGSGLVILVSNLLTDYHANKKPNTKTKKHKKIVKVV
jgi:hypothetical protein